MPYVHQIISKFKKSRRGFSLIEVIVSLFIFGLIMTAASQIFTRAFAGHRHARSLQHDIENAQYLSGILAKELRTSTIVNPNSPTSGAQSVQFYDHSQGLCIQYRIRSNALQVAKQNSTGPSACNVASLSVFTTVSSGTISGAFDVTPSSPSPHTVGRVTLALRIQEGTHSEVIQSTVSLRDFGTGGSNL
jgi:prepilin-type N-terminal cleavage/methylation domain-containing protein